MVWSQISITQMIECFGKCAPTGPAACLANHSLHFGLSAPPTASQASVPGVAQETHDMH